MAIARNQVSPQRGPLLLSQPGRGGSGARCGSSREARAGNLTRIAYANEVAARKAGPAVTIAEQCHGRSWPQHAPADREGCRGGGSHSLRRTLVCGGGSQGSPLFRRHLARATYYWIRKTCLGRRRNWWARQSKFSRSEGGEESVNGKEEVWGQHQPKEAYYCHCYHYSLLPRDEKQNTDGILKVVEQPRADLAASIVMPGCSADQSTMER